MDIVKRNAFRDMLKAHGASLEDMRIFDRYSSIEDKQCAWKIFIDLTTRITIVPYEKDVCDDAEALVSIYRLFGGLRSHMMASPKAMVQSVAAKLVMDHILRPFLHKWHNLNQDEKFGTPFHEDLEILRGKMWVYAEYLESATMTLSEAKFREVFLPAKQRPKNCPQAEYFEGAKK